MTALTGKTSKHLKLILYTGLVLLAMVLLFLKSRQISTVTDEMSLKLTRSVASSTVPVYSPVPGITPTNSSTAKKSAIEQYILDEHPAALEKRIEQRDSYLGRYRLLAKRKILLQEAEKQELAHMLGDDTKRMAYEAYLRENSLGDKSLAEEQIYRLYLIQYLASVNEQHPNRDTIDFLQDFILLDNISREAQLERKKVLAYEKEKALRLLQTFDPDAFLAIKDLAKGLPHERFLLDTLRRIQEDDLSHGP